MLMMKAKTTMSKPRFPQDFLPMASEARLLMPSHAFPGSALTLSTVRSLVSRAEALAPSHFRAPHAFIAMPTGMASGPATPDSRTLAAASLCCALSKGHLFFTCHPEQPGAASLPAACQG